MSWYGPGATRIAGVLGVFGVCSDVACRVAVKWACRSKDGRVAVKRAHRSKDGRIAVRGRVASR